MVRIGYMVTLGRRGQDPMHFVSESDDAIGRWLIANCSTLPVDEPAHISLCRIAYDSVDEHTVPPGKR